MCSSDLLFVLKIITDISDKLSQIKGKPVALNKDKYNIMKQRNWKCDITELKQQLEFIPEYSLEKGVKETICWYKENGWL